MRTREHAGGEASGEDRRDACEERVFPPLPPPARGRSFTRTWWGTRWLKALEETALDTQQLRLGRKFARQGGVGAVSVRPGRITAVVRGPDGTAYRADVLLRVFSEAEWDRLLAVSARESGHTAALLDGEMPPRLVEDAEEAGVELLPGIGDLDAECECGAWDHCPHTAALCYQTARLLDEDPFALLWLRGKEEGAFLSGLGLRGSGETAPAGTIDGPGVNAPQEQGSSAVAPRGRAGVPADEVFAAGALRTLPRTVEPVHAPAVPLSLTGGTSPAAGRLDPAALEFLAADAVVRARRMLREALSPTHADSLLPLRLTLRQDAVRMVAAAGRPPGERVLERLAAGCRLTTTQLCSAAEAWEAGGPEGLSAWEERESPPM